LSAAIQHLERRCVVVYFGLREESPYSDDGLERLPQWASRQVPRKMHGLRGVEFVTGSPAARLPRERGAAVRPRAHEPGTGLAHAVVEGVEHRESAACGGM